MQQPARSAARLCSTSSSSNSPIQQHLCSLPARLSATTTHAPGPALAACIKELHRGSGLSIRHRRVVPMPLLCLDNASLEDLPPIYVHKAICISVTAPPDAIKHYIPSQRCVDRFLARSRPHLLYLTTGLGHASQKDLGNPRNYFAINSAPSMKMFWGLDLYMAPATFKVNKGWPAAT